MRLPADMVPKLPVFLLNSVYRDIQLLLIANMIYKRSAILRFFLLSSGWGGDVLNLVFGSSYSSYMDGEVHCVSSVTIGLIGVRF